MDPNRPPPAPQDPHPGPRAPRAPPEPPRKRRKFTYADKLAIIKEIEGGKRRADVTKKYGVNESTIRTIWGDREKIKKVMKGNPGEGNQAAVKVANIVLKTTEKLIGQYIERQRRNGVPTDGKKIREKAKTYYAEVARKLSVGSPPPFKASHGWLCSFVRRHKLKNVKLAGEVASADTVAANIFPAFLRDIIVEGGYTSEQIFNCDETGVYWRKMPRRTYIFKKFKSAKGYKIAKERVTLLLTCNAAGTCKLKPLVIYRSKKPRPYRNEDMTKLNVHWLSNKKGWVSGAISLKWFDECLVPELERYCRRCNINFHILLMMDNAPGHSKLLENRHPNIKVVFMPPNTTSLLQPLDQEVIANFKAAYATKTFNMMDAATDTQEELDQMSDLDDDTPAQADNPPEPRPGPSRDPPAPPPVTDPDEPQETPAVISVLAFWKNFNIRNAVDTMVEAWGDVTQATIHHAWRNVLEGLPGHKLDVPGVPQSVEEAVGGALAVARRVPGLADVNREDIIDMLDPANAQEDDIERVLEEEEEEEEEQRPGDEDLPPDEPTNSVLRDLLELGEKLTHLAANDDPNHNRADLFCATINSALQSYKDMLNIRVNRRQQKHITEYFQRRQPPPPPQQPEGDDQAGDLFEGSDVDSDFSGWGSEDDRALEQLGGRGGAPSSN